MQHEKKKMTRKEAIDSLQKHCPVNDPGAIIDFYIEAGMLEIVEEPNVGINFNSKNYPNGLVIRIDDKIVYKC